MEPISAVASIVTLAGLAKELSTLTINLFCGLKSAPADLARLQQKISLIVLELEFLQQSTVPPGSDHLLDTSELRVLAQSLEIARRNLQAIHGDCKAISRRPKSRVRWALFEKKKANEYLAQIQTTESTLGVILQLMNMKTTLRSYSATQDQLGKTQDAVRALAIGQQSHINTKVSRADVATVPSSAGQRYVTTITLNDFLRWIFACELLALITSDGCLKQYHYFIMLSLPTLTSRLAMKISLYVQRRSNSWRCFDVLGGRISIVNYVPANSAIVTACRNGDLVAVRDLFRRGKAHPTDVSDHSTNLLWYATESGSTDLAEFLIREGALITNSNLLAAAYRRRPEIARLSLKNGVDVEFIASDGQTAVMLLFGSSRKPEPQTEFIEILASHSFENFDGQDECGWTALHRAASWGSRADVQTLLQMKASVDVPTYNLGWSPLFCAVCFGNLEALEELWPHYEDPSQAEDLRHWNLLHVAAGAGKLDVVRFLLGKGVDLDAVSQATRKFVPPALSGIAATPSQVARSCGGEFYSTWCESLVSMGREPDVPFTDVDWTLEKHAGNHGGCECCTVWGF
jgi:ankyrin repeat protein